MEESGSEGLDDLIFARKDTFFKDVDYICISDNYWLRKKKGWGDDYNLWVSQTT